MQFLAGVLHHRGPNTESERRAAEYIRGRFEEHTPDTEIDNFDSLESYYNLIGFAYTEFLVIALVSIWFPIIAFAYGLFVFMMYQSEIGGYRLMGRLLAQFQTQNVVARFLGIRPRHTFVVVAHYDSPKGSPLSNPGIAPWIRPVHFFLVFCMFVVLVSCAAQAFNILDVMSYRVDLLARWTAAGFLMAAALFLFYCEYTYEYEPGANDNASGVAVLLALAEQLKEHPIEDADVWLAATGSKEAGQNGMRRLIGTHDFDKEHTYFLNVDTVGAGALRYVTAEGLQAMSKASPAMLQAVRQVADDFEATPYVETGIPSDAYIAMSRDFHALTLTATESMPMADDEPLAPDNLVHVDYEKIAKAGAFTDATLRALAAQLATSRQSSEVAEGE
jgi:hypothetical protein